MADEFLNMVSDLKGQLEEQIKLEEISKKIVSTLDLDEVLQTIVDSTCDLLDCDRATCFMVHPAPTGGGMELVSRRIVANEINEIRVPCNRNSIAGYAAASGETITIKDVYDSSELHAINPELSFDRTWDQKTGYRTTSVLVSPTKSGDVVVGVIQALNKNGDRPFDSHDVELINKLTNFVGIALQNSQSHTRILRRMKSRQTLEDILLEKGLITDLKLKEAQEKTKKERRKLFQVLVEDYEIGEENLSRALAELNGVDYLEYDPEHHKIDPALFDNIPEVNAKRNLLCPLKQVMGGNGDLQLHIVMHNPKDFVALEDIEIRTKSKVAKIFMATPTAIHHMIRDTLHPDQTNDSEEENIGSLFDELAEDLGIEPEEEEVEAASVNEGVNEEDNAVVRLCNRIVEDAYRLGGTDIHIEPMENYVLVRTRRDGTLQKMLTVPGHAKNALVARFKIMGDMNITEHRVPQDGRIRFKEHGGRYDVELRVNICPTVGGNEDIVMRILADSKLPPLDKLGLLPWVYEPFMEEVRKPYGMILVVGPTGSGKTTTLHAAVASINTPDTKILTAENPVEITQEGLRQVQIRPEVGLTFKEALRAFLRQDPNVILVGEMRDFETCSIAVEAALTGHVLFSTLHTNNAPETVTRLIDIGIDPVTLSDALLCVLSQRLVKTLCKNCKVKTPIPDEDLVHIEGAAIEGDVYKYLGKEFPVSESYIKGPGCEKCNGTGLSGRTGIHELLKATAEVKKGIVSGARIQELRDMAKTPDPKNGFRMYELFEDGFFKVMMGRTGLHQILAECRTD